MDEFSVKPLAQEAAEAQIDNPLYECSVCGATVIVFNGTPFYTCYCDNRQIVVTAEGMRHGL